MLHSNVNVEYTAETAMNEHHEHQITLQGSSQSKRRSSATKNRTSSMIHLASGPHPSLSIVNSSQGIDTRGNVTDVEKRDSGQGAGIRQSLSLSGLQFPSKQQGKDNGFVSESTSGLGQNGPGQKTVRVDAETKSSRLTTSTRCVVYIII